jgi:hypothetical protein
MDASDTGDALESSVVAPISDDKYLRNGFRLKEGFVGREDRTAGSDSSRINDVDLNRCSMRGTYGQQPTTITMASSAILQRRKSTLPTVNKGDRLPD